MHQGFGVYQAAAGTYEVHVRRKVLVKVPGTLHLWLRRLGPLLVGHVVEHAIPQDHGTLHHTFDLLAALLARVREALHLASIRDVALVGFSDDAAGSQAA